MEAAPLLSDRRHKTTCMEYNISGDPSFFERFAQRLTGHFSFLGLTLRFLGENMSRNVDTSLTVI